MLLAVVLTSCLSDGACDFSVEQLRAVAEASKESVANVGAAALRSAHAEGLFNRFSRLRGVAVEDALDRIAVLRLVNVLVAEVLPLIDFGPSRAEWSLANRVSRLRHRLLYDTKEGLWRGIMLATMTNTHRPRVAINRARAIKGHESALYSILHRVVDVLVSVFVCDDVCLGGSDGGSAEGDPEGRRSVFGQLFRALHFLPPARLRTADRTWQADYVGEGSIDAGGPFRDSITHLCNDLQDTMLPLFVPCANAQGFGDNQDAWMPSPAAVSSLHLSMLAFVGKLMGVAMRAKHILNLNLSPLVWKLLVGTRLTCEDILDVDALTYEMIQKVRLAVRTGEVCACAFLFLFSHPCFCAVRARDCCLADECGGV